MIAEKDLSQLLTDLDCDGYGIRNCKQVFADNLVTTDDPRLFDARAILPASVTNLSVAGPPVPDIPEIPSPEPPPPAGFVGIEQSKLNLDGNLPPSFISATGDSDHGVPGDLYQPVAEKAVANGYASLDATKHIPIGQITGAGTGTLKELVITTPSELSLVPPMNPIDGVISLSGVWTAAPKMSWFGNPSGADDARPRFYLGTLPTALIPSLDAAILASGVLFPYTLPVAIGVGVTHAAGAVPDPGKEGDPSDYLGRDMKYHAMVTTLNYQPTLPSPALSVLSVGEGGEVKIVISSSIKDAVCFYRIAPMTLFEQFSEPVLLSLGETIEAYAVKTGYNPSPVAYYTNTFIEPSEQPPTI